ncbi:unnamed protein product [Prunus brigantina]
MYVFLCSLIRVMDHLRTTEIVCRSLEQCWKNRPRRWSAHFLQSLSVIPTQDSFFVIVLKILLPIFYLIVYFHQRPYGTIMEGVKLGGLLIKNMEFLVLNL